MGYLYHTPFTLELPVHDKKAANAYLQDDDMAEYLRDHLDREQSSLKPEEVLRADWRMETDQAGDIQIEVTRPLTETECVQISGWIQGQNSDGLGEGFEQQPFAEWEEEDSPYVEMASFCSSPCTLEQLLTERDLADLGSSELNL